MIAARERLLARDVEVARGRLDPSMVLNLTGYPGGGSILQDRSLYRNNGTISGATWVRTPGGLWCLSFDGTDDSVDCGDNPSHNCDTRLYLAAWVYNESTAAGQIFQRKSAANVYCYRLYTNSKTSLTFDVWNASNVRVYQDFNCAGDKWEFVECFYDGANIWGAVNFIESTKKAQTGQIQQVTAHLYLGRNVVDSNQPFKGRIALPQVCNAIPTTSQRTSFYNATRHLFGI